MNIPIEHSWKNILKEEFEKSYMKKLSFFLEDEYTHKVIFPPKKKLFSAFHYTPFDQVNVVIIGQDPYHGKGQANGLCFSVEDNVKIPPSLQNIYKEIHKEFSAPIPTSGNLDHWAKQGVLLLNAILSVEEKNPGSHKNKGWEIFTDAIIKKISDQKEHVVFLLWGAYAQKKGSIIDTSKHLVLTSPHPSPFSAYKGFFGNDHFIKTNEYLQKHHQKKINW